MARFPKSATSLTLTPNIISAAKHSTERHPTPLDRSEPLCAGHPSTLAPIESLTVRLFTDSYYGSPKFALSFAVSRWQGSATPVELCVDELHGCVDSSV